MTKRLNIFELDKIIKEKNNKKNASFNKVLEICHKRIKRSATNYSQTKILMDLPIHIYGYPLYDIEQCIKFIVNTLKKDGFIVKVYKPITLYISWDIDEINKDNKIIKIK